MYRFTIADRLRSSAGTFALVGLLASPLACARGGTETQKGTPTLRESDEYFAAYRGCFEVLGPEARAAGERAIETAARRVASGEGGPERLRESCKAASKQLAAACR